MTALGGKVIFGTLIIVVGIFLARIIANLVGSGTGEGGYAQTLVRYAIIALFTAIGLTFMGLADQIVMMAFGLILGSAAIACAHRLRPWRTRRRGAHPRSLGGRSRRRSHAAAAPRAESARRHRPGRGRAAAAGLMTWDEAVAFALTLPGTELGTSYGKPAVKVAPNGRAFLFPSHEAGHVVRASRSTSTRSRSSRRPTRRPSGRRRTMSAGRAC